jgi:hypothetical protein
MHMLGFFPLFFGAPFFMYFLPTIIAIVRGKRDIVGILLLNFFLGWTVIGWFIALIWAAKADVQYVVVR